MQVVILINLPTFPTDWNPTDSSTDWNEKMLYVSLKFNFYLNIRSFQIQNAYISHCFPFV